MMNTTAQAAVFCTARGATHACSHQSGVSCAGLALGTPFLRTYLVFVGHQRQVTQGWLWLGALTSRQHKPEDESREVARQAEACEECGDGTEPKADGNAEEDQDCLDVRRQRDLVDLGEEWGVESSSASSRGREITVCARPAASRVHHVFRMLRGTTCAVTPPRF